MIPGAPLDLISGLLFLHYVTLRWELIMINLFAGTVLN